MKASLHDIRCPFDVPDEAFMAAELFPAHWRDTGNGQYHPEFDLVSG
jgi:predicted N-acetyltransferase YhbS